MRLHEADVVAHDKDDVGQQIVAAGMRRNACVKETRTPATIRPGRGL
jgi:hypothetical protein